MTAEHRTVRRRDLLGFLLIAIAPLTLAAGARIYGSIRPGSEAGSARARRWIEIFKSPARLRRLGLDYLAHQSTGSRKGGTSWSVFAHLEDRAGPEGIDDARRCIREQIESDFAQGRIQNVAGWLLARSEAELCAAVVALQPEQRS